MSDIETRNRKARRYINKCRHLRQAKMERVLVAVAAGSVLLSLTIVFGWLL